MIELASKLPDVNVHQGEFQRLLGYPRDWKSRGRARKLADWARAWYAKNGQPWVYARRADSLHVQDTMVLIDGVVFQSGQLASTLDHAEADEVILVAVSAGPELEEEAQRAWLAEKPDEYFFLEVYGSAVVEHLTTMTGAQLCAWAEARELAVLPHYSPGYPQWDASEQPRLLDLIRRGGSLPGPLATLDSGMLRPKKSLLAVFGITRNTSRVRQLSQLVPCENCSYLGCQYRRAPYVRPPEHLPSETPLRTAAPAIEPSPNAAPLSLEATYSVNAKALERWTASRLVLDHRDDGSVAARFRYEGTTCTNMGRSLAFDYAVTLSPRDDGYLILEQQCEPAAGDIGHVAMCAYITDSKRLMDAIGGEQPLAGQPLDAALSCQWPASAAGCYCDGASRTHKWGLVLQTIHYALAQQEKQN